MHRAVGFQQCRGRAPAARPCARCLHRDGQHQGCTHDWSRPLGCQLKKASGLRPRLKQAPCFQLSKRSQLCMHRKPGCMRTSLNAAPRGPCVNPSCTETCLAASDVLTLTSPSMLPAVTAGGGAAAAPFGAQVLVAAVSRASHASSWTMAFPMWVPVEGTPSHWLASTSSTNVSGCSVCHA